MCVLIVCMWGRRDEGRGGGWGVGGGDDLCGFFLCVTHMHPILGFLYCQHAGVFICFRFVAFLCVYGIGETNVSCATVRLC